MQIVLVWITFSHKGSGDSSDILCKYEIQQCQIIFPNYRSLKTKFLLYIPTIHVTFNLHNLLQFKIQTTQLSDTHPYNVAVYVLQLFTCLNTCFKSPYEWATNRVRACNSNKGPQSGRNFTPVLKMELWSRVCIATITFYAVCVVHVTIFSTGGKFRPVSIFTQLHALTLVACSYALLLLAIIQTQAVKNHQIYLSMSGTNIYFGVLGLWDW